MSRFLNTIGKSPISVAICDRCRFKFPYVELRPDGNAPGLRVCDGCCDLYDPYKLPARRTENIALRHPRPDEPIVVPEDS